MQSRDQVNEKLTKAVQAGDLEGVRNALDAGADVNYVTSSHHTVLSVASLYRHTEIVRLLLAKDEIDVNQTDKFGYTALVAVLMQAATSWDEESYCWDFTPVRLLLERKEIDIYHATESGWTALNLALRVWCSDIVRLLLDHCIAVIDDPALLISCEKIFNRYAYLGPAELSYVGQAMIEMMVNQKKVDKIDVYLKQINFIVDAINKNKYPPKNFRKTMRTFISEKLHERFELAIHSGEIDALKTEKAKFELISESLSIIQKTKKDKNEKTAKKNLLGLIDQLNEKINVKTQQDPLLAQEKTFSDLKKFLDNEFVEVENLIGGAWLERWDDSQIKKLREFLSTLTPVERETLKKGLYQAIKDIADKKPLPPNDAELMRKMRKAYFDGTKAGLFELLRIGNREKVDHDTGTWNDFRALMGDGKSVRFLKVLGVLRQSPEQLARQKTGNIVENDVNVRTLQFGRIGNEEL